MVNLVAYASFALLILSHVAQASSLLVPRANTCVHHYVTGCRPQDCYKLHNCTDAACRKDCDANPTEGGTCMYNHSCCAVSTNNPLCLPPPQASYTIHYPCSLCALLTAAVLMTLYLKKALCVDWQSDMSLNT